MCALYPVSRFPRELGLLRTVRLEVQQILYKVAFDMLSISTTGVPRAWEVLRSEYTCLCPVTRSLEGSKLPEMGHY